MAGVPSAMTQFTSPIVGKALETGARGQTQKHTDYGVIGDAFFKKAQLDLQMANLHADMGIKKAEILSGLEMDRARLELQKGEMLTNAAHLDWQRREYEKAQEVSDSEKLLGTLSGAVSGAVTGMTLSGGNPIGGVVGAVAGGGMSYMGYQQGGRQGGQQAQQTLGVIAQGAQTIKGLHDEKVAKDSWSGLAQQGLDYLNKAQNPNLPPEERAAAYQQYQGTLNEVYKWHMDQGHNPEMSSKGVGAFDKGLRGNIGDDPKEQAYYRMEQRAITAAADEGFKDPAQSRSKVRQLRKDMAMDYAIMTGGEDLPPHVFEGYLEQIKPAKPAIQDMPTKNLKKPGMDSSTSAHMSPERAVIQDYADVPDPKKGQAPKNDPTYTNPTAMQQNGYRPPLVAGGGVIMDDQGPISGQAPTETDLLKQGGETVEALKKSGGAPAVPGQAEVDSINTGTGGEPIIPLADPEDKLGRFGRAKYEALKAPFSADELEKVDPEKFNEEVVKTTKENAKFDAELQSVKKTPEAEDIIDSIDKQIEMIKNGEVKTFNSQTAKIGRSIRDKGIGGKLGDMAGLDVGKDTTAINMDELEAQAWDEIEQDGEMNASMFSTLSGEKGARSEGDIARFKKLNASPGKTKLQVIKNLVAQKELVLRKLKSKQKAGPSIEDQKKELDLEISRNKLGMMGVENENTMLDNRKKKLDVEEKTIEVQGSDWEVLWDADGDGVPDSF